MLRHRYIARALREPLVHFLVLGVAIFAGYAVVSAPVPSPDRIVVSRADIGHLGSLWEKRWQRPPTKDELRTLIDEHVREEVLYREALALGLDRGDTVIRRRLRQKFEFVTQDLAVATDPEPAELRAWYEANRDRYQAAPRLSFEQVYFNLDRRDLDAERDAMLTLAGLRKGVALSRDLGDSQMFDTNYRDLTAREVEAIFGGDFLIALSSAEIGRWSGPVRSGYGLHLVRVNERNEGRVQPFETVERQVWNDWAYHQRRQANDALFKHLIDRYEIVIDTPLYASKEAER